MSPEKNMPKTGEDNAPPLTLEKKAQKFKKRRRRLVKKFLDEKSVPDDSASPLSTSEKKTPNSLKPKRKNMKKSSNEKLKLGESSSALSPSKKETLVSPNSKGEIVSKSLKGKSMLSNSKEVTKSSNEKLKLGESSSALSPSKKRTLVSPNSKGEIVSKSLKGKSMLSDSKEVQNSQNLVKKPNKKFKPVNNKNHKPEVANKGSHSGKAKEVESSSKDHLRNNYKKNIGGFIFMCNAKTKQDCYQYRVMGVQEHKKDLVMGIKPGMKLFLFDINVKILYGIYKATSGGGLRLEPAAFRGGFPLQVRFEVHKDCLPLPESVFKKAIKENYDEKTHKFKTELTFNQVKRLTNLFKPAPVMHSNPQSVVSEPKPTVASSSLLLTEQDYRSYGLGDRHNNLAPVGPPAYDPYWPNLEREGTRTDTVFISRPERETVQLVKTTLTSPPVLLSEQEYRSYGLRGDRPPPVYDPYKPDLEREGAHHDSVYLNRPSEQESTKSMQLLNPTLTSPPVLLTEQEYRSYGLRGDRPPPVYDPYKPDLERERAHPDSVYLNRLSEQESTTSWQLLNPTLTSPAVLLTEQEYRSYGLRGDRPPPVYDPYKPDLERDRAHPDSVYLNRPTEHESTTSMQLVNPNLTSPPVLLTEQGYRSYGLRGDRLPPAYDPYKIDQERTYSRAPHNALFLSEKDYRTYGLKSRQENPTSITPSMDATNHNPAIGFHQSVPYNPYDQDSDLVERYLPHHVAPPSSSYRFDPDTVLSERLYPRNASNEPSSYNQNVGQRAEETGYKSAPVSSRYAFAGPSVVHR